MKKFLKNINIIIAFVVVLSFLNPEIGCCAQNSSTAQVSKIETSIWGFEYKKDNLQKRLSRIERNVFGQENSSLNDTERIKKINEAMGFEAYEDSIKEAYELDQTEVSGISYPQIDTLEVQLFSSTYEKENIYKRLDRLEKKIFGSTQSGDLAQRTDRLKAYVKKDAIAKNPNYYIEQPYKTTPDIENYMNSQKRYDDSDVYIQLSGLEAALFSQTFSQDPIGLRLNRLERKIFQRDFSSDDENLRLQRLQAAASAQKTAKMYEANKIQKYTSTGIQIGSIILMILALIL